MTEIQERTHWPELDVMRGLAACLMVANHAGFAWIAADQRAFLPGSCLIFLGGFAPVLFFFVTGLGYGVQMGRRTQSHSAGLFTKVGLLLAIEAALRIVTRQSLLALDFLGFIAFSMLVLELLRRRTRPTIWAESLLLLILGGRYLLGPAFRAAAAPYPALAFLGVSDVPGFAFPLFPWLAYPLCGFLVGSYLVKESSPRRTGWLILAAGLGWCAVTVGLWGMGQIIFRWGTVSLTFFVAGLGVAGLVLGLVLLTRDRAGWLTSAVSLRGVSSLAVVPVHYQVIGWGSSVFGQTLTSLGYAGVLAVVLVLVLMLSRGVAWVGARVGQMPGARVVLICAAVVCVGCATVWPPMAQWSGGVAVRGAQVVLCMVLALAPRMAKPARVQEEVVGARE